MHSFPEPSGVLAFSASHGSVAASAEPYDRQMLDLVARNMRRFAGPHPDLDDLIQKALLGTHRALPSFRGEAQLSTFLYSICYRVWVQHTRWHTRFLQRFRLTEEGILPEEVDSRDPAELVMHRERYAELYRALERIPHLMRAVVVLHDLDELELEEIAAIVGANVHTVRSRLRHGRQKLRIILSKQVLRGGQL